MYLTLSENTAQPLLRGFWLGLVTTWGLFALYKQSFAHYFLHIMYEVIAYILYIFLIWYELIIRSMHFYCVHCEMYLFTFCYLYKDSALKNIYLFPLLHILLGLVFLMQQPFMFHFFNFIILKYDRVYHFVHSLSG